MNDVTLLVHSGSDGSLCHWSMSSSNEKEPPSRSYHEGAGSGVGSGRIAAATGAAAVLSLFGTATSCASDSPAIGGAAVCFEGVRHRPSATDELTASGMA